MAIGTHSDLVIFDEEYISGQIEFLAQNLALFNGNSAGAITLASEMLKGYYEKTDFIPVISDMFSRRDTTDVTTSVTDYAVGTTEIAKVKMLRKSKALTNTIGAWKTIGSTPEELSFKLGQMIANGKALDQVHLILSALVAAIGNVSDLTYDARSDTIDYCAPKTLLKAMRKMGDRSGDIVAWVMHSTPFHDLVEKDIDDAVDSIFGRVRITGPLSAALGRPCIVLDDDALDVAAAGTSTSTSADDVEAYYYVLGLVRGAGEVVDSEGETRAWDLVSDKQESLAYRMRVEYALNLGIKGFTWDTTNGGQNPTDATIATGSNWDQVATSVKDCGGVLLKVNAK